MNKKSAKFSKHEENGTIMKCLRHFLVNNTKKKYLENLKWNQRNLSPLGNVTSY